MIKKPVMHTNKASDIYSHYDGLLETFSEQEKQSDFNNVWKEGVLVLLAKIAHELEKGGS